MQLLPRIRTVLARHPWVWWSAVVLLAGVAGVIAATAVRRVDAQRREWGDTRTVWVASAAVDPGEAVVAKRHEYPAAMVPSSAVVALPPGTLALHLIADGEVIVAADVAPNGLAGLVPAGSVAVAVPIRSAVMHAGDHVAAFANGVRLGDGVVVSVDGEQVVLAIPADAAPALTMAVPAGAVVLALLPPP